MMIWTLAKFIHGNSPLFKHNQRSRKIIPQGSYRVAFKEKGIKLKLLNPLLKLEPMTRIELVTY